MDNKALELADKLAPFLQPAPSGDQELIKTVADFSLEISPAQNAVLTKLEMLTLEPNLSSLEKQKIRLKVERWEKRKRYHDAKYFIDSTVMSLSWRRFAQSGFIQGQVNKNQQS